MYKHSFTGSFLLKPTMHIIGITILVGTVIAISSSVAFATASSAPLKTPVADQVGCLSDAFKKRIERGLSGYADVADIPGISIGIVASDSLVYAASVGYANKAEQRAASPDTLYNIASVTKIFTATLALSLAEDGIVQLDIPVSTYLPKDVRVPVDAAGGEITIRHLLSHTAGLPKDPPNRRNLDTKGPIDPGIWDTYSVSDLYAALPATTLKGKIGEHYNYSNYGYALLGHVLERAGGASFESLLRKRILAPLGMSDTAITLSPEQARRLAAFYWSENPDRTEAPLQARYGEVAAFIGLSSNVRDLAIFTAAHLQRDPGKSNPIPISARAVSAKPRTEAYTDPLFRIDIGLGWFHETKLDDQTVVLYHTGEVDGHTAGLYLDPSLGIGVVVLQNLGGDVGTRGIEQIGAWLLVNTAKEMRNTTSCTGDLTTQSR
jgi:serine-type D-Ala-D-Ala carboxypeptidase/endopeptidase